MPFHRVATPSIRTPSAARSSRHAAAVLALAVLLGQTAHAGPGRWTAADVIRMARARASQIQVTRRRAELAAARAAYAGLPPDPSVSFYREQTFGDVDPSQDVASISWPIDLSGRRPGERALLRSDAARARSEAALDERTAIARALEAFYAVIAARRRTAAAEARVAALGEVERVLAEREAAGAASGYARARLGIEADLAKSRLASSRTRESIARDRLVALVAPGAEELPALASDLTTSSPPPVRELLERVKAQHPGLRHARAALAAAEDAKDAAELAWIPTFAVTGGYNEVRGDRTERGYVVGLEFDLPIFSRGGELGARASARRRLARAENLALERRLTRRIARSRTRLVAARRELARFEEATGDRVASLLRGAKVSYEEGRRPLVEVLDAQRAATDVRLRRIELALEAVRAEVALERATGGWQ